MTPEERQEKDEAISRLFLDLDGYKQARRILFYASFRSEVTTWPLIQRAMAEGKMAALPKVLRAEKRLGIYSISSIDGLLDGYLGIREPAALPEDELDPELPDIIVMPGAAFDRSGNRIGYGGGYYDRLLEKAGQGSLRVALAYGVQMVDHIPSESHDRRVDMVITEDGVIRCR